MNRARATLLEYLTATGTESPFIVAEVVAITVGGAADGTDLVTVRWLGTDVYATYGDHYTPAVGHVVRIARGQPLYILGRIIGTPPSTY